MAMAAIARARETIPENGEKNIATEAAGIGNDYNAA